VLDRRIEQPRALVEPVEWTADRQREALKTIGFSP
jgi:hypothetical protein